MDRVLLFVFRVCLLYMYNWQPFGHLLERADLLALLLIHFTLATACFQPKCVM